MMCIASQSPRESTSHTPLNMASRPLPPGRRGRGSRTESALHLPEVKLMEGDGFGAPSSTRIIGQLLESESQGRANTEPEHESIAKHAEVEPTPVRSVKAFAASLESTTEFACVKQQSKSPAPPVAAGVVEQPRLVDPKLTTTAAAPLVVTTPVATPPPAPQTTSSERVPTPVISAEPALAVARQIAPVVAAHTPTVQVQLAPVPVIEQTQTTIELGEIHPFQILMPVYAVPDVPEAVGCVYDEAAAEMQKNIMKAVKKFFSKDRVRLEDFKINARLYGNNFMDPHEYVEYLAKDLGGNRALQLVPCLLSLQPDYMKRNSLLVAARAFRVRNMAKLQAACDKVQVTPPAPEETPAPMPTLEASAAVVVESLPSIEVTSVAEENPKTPAIESAAAVSAPPITQPLSNASTSVACEAEPVADEYIPPADENTIHDDPESIPINDTSPAQSESIEHVEIQAAPFVETAIEAKATTSATVHEITTPEVYDVKTEEASVCAICDSSATVQAGPEPVVHAQGTVDDDAETPAPLLETQNDVTIEHIEVPLCTVPEAPSVAIVVQVEPTIQVATPPQVNEDPRLAEPTVTEDPPSRPLRVETLPEAFANGSGSSAVTPTSSTLHLVGDPVAPTPAKPIRRQSTINLFGQDIGNTDDSDSDDEIHPVPFVPAKKSPSSPTTTELEVESLFGEVIPPSSTTSSPATAPLAAAPVAPSRPSMLFGFASTNSDSDSDSDFSD